MRSSPDNVLITGASSGIGLELARCFAAEKSNLILVSRNVSALEQLAAELRIQYSIKVDVLPKDLSEPTAVEGLFQELEQRKIQVDVLVNNAGFGLHGYFHELPLSRQLEIIQLNVLALTKLTGLFLPAMRERRRGGILNVGSVAGFLPGPNLAVYYASKAYVVSFTEALAEEIADSGLKVSVLCPGPTESNFGMVARNGKPRRLERPKMSARDVAQIGYEEFRKGRVVAVSGLSNKALVFLVRFLPRGLVRSLVKKFNQI